MMLKNNSVHCIENQFMHLVGEKTHFSIVVEMKLESF